MDIRNPEIEKFRIKACCPKLFFKKCNKCELEFRKTPMWKYLDYRQNQKYLCMNCISNYEDLIDYITFVRKDKPKPLNPCPTKVNKYWSN